MSKVIAFYWTSIFMLANGSLFTWMFRGTPLIIWRQIIWAIGMFFLFKYVRTFNSIGLVKILKVHLYIFIFFLFQALITLAVYNFNYLRLLFAFWTYFSGLPFLIFPFLIFNSEKESVKKFCNIFIGFGCFLTIGLFTDYLTGGFFTKFFLLSVTSSLENLLSSGRYCFLSEAPTTFGVYFCFCLLCTLYRLYIETSNVKKLILFFIAILYIGGGWLTGSRQIVLVLVVVLAIALIYYIILVNENKKFIVIGLSLLLILIPFIKSFLFSDKTYQDRYSSSSIKEDTRYKAWENGWRENVIDNVDVFFVGKAIALSQGQKAHKGELQGSHYENTYFARLSETGIVGVFLLLLPFLYFLFYWHKTDFFNVLLLLFFFSYLFISYISPNGAHQTTQMVVYLALGFFLNKKQFNKDI